MDQSENKYSFRQFLIAADHSQMTNSRFRNQFIDCNILEAIGDSSETPISLSFSEKIIQFYKSFGFVIRPGNTFLLIWQFVLMCIIIFFILEPGLLLGFGQEFWSDELNNFLVAHIFFIIVLTTDILISPLKSYYDEGLLITDIPTIFRKYFALEFWIDAIGITVIIFPLATGQLLANWVKLLWLMKIYTASKINVEFERVTQLYITYNTAYLVFKLIVFCYIYGHYMGIFFYLVSKWVYTHNYYGPNTPNLCWIYNSWALYQMTLYLSWQQMYLYIMYYSIAVVTTIAYGDITPKNPIECLYTILALIIVTLIFGYLMTEILRVLINVFSYNFDRRYTHYSFINRLKDEKVQQSIQIQIRAHSNQIDRQEQFRNRKIQQKIMNFLPPEPLYGLLVVIYQAFLKELGFSFFQLSNLTMQPFHHKSLFLENFMKDIKEERHYPGDLLYNQKDIENPSVYYFTKNTYTKAVILGVGSFPVLKAGKLDISQNKKRNSFEICRATSIFGQIQFLNGSQRSHWALCLSNCVLFVASRNSLFQHYHLLTQQEKQEVFTKMEQASESMCLLCRQGHSFFKCPYAFLNMKGFLNKDRQVSRKDRILKEFRTRLKTKSSWTIFQKIKNIRMKITKQYREKLLFNKADHSLFMQYELEEDNYDHEQEDFETKLHETEVMVEKMYQELLEEMGKVSQGIQYDKVCVYSHYKPHNNITNVDKQMLRSGHVKVLLKHLGNILQ